LASKYLWQYDETGSSNPLIIETKALVWVKRKGTLKPVLMEYAVNTTIENPAGENFFVHQGSTLLRDKLLHCLTLLLLLPGEYSLPAATQLVIYSGCFVSILAMPTLTLVSVVACD